MTLPGPASSRALAPDSRVQALATSLEWTFVEDRVSQGSASKELVRAGFRAWIASGADGAKQPRAISHWSFLKAPRCGYFVYGDEGALRSVVNEALQRQTSI